MMELIGECRNAFEVYFRATWPEPSDGIMYCRPQMERDFKAGWDAANAPLLEIMQEASDFLKSIEGAGYGGISRYDVLCVRLEEAMKGSTGKPPMLEADCNHTLVVDNATEKYEGTKP